MAIRDIEKLNKLISHSKPSKKRMQLINDIESIRPLVNQLMLLYETDVKDMFDSYDYLRCNGRECSLSRLMGSNEKEYNYLDNRNVILVRNVKNNTLHYEPYHVVVVDKNTCSLLVSSRIDFQGIVEAYKYIAIKDLLNPDDEIYRYENDMWGVPFQKNHVYDGCEYLTIEIIKEYLSSTIDLLSRLTKTFFDNIDKLSKNN